MSQFANRNRLNIRLSGMARAARPQIVQALRRGGMLIENEAVEGIINPPKTGRIYRSKHRRGALHQASAPGEFPAADSGRLHQSITSALVQNDDIAVVVQTAANAPYATMLEYGTSKMEPRPFMTPAYRNNRERIRRMVEVAVERAVRGQAGGGGRR